MALRSITRPNTASAETTTLIFSVNTPVDSFDTNRDCFIGAYREGSNPEAVENGCCSNSIASGWSPIAAHQISLTLAPGRIPQPDLCARLR